MVTHDIDTKNQIVDTVCGSRLDGGAKLVFLSAADILMATISLNSDAFAVADGGQAIANGFPKMTTIVYANTITKFQIIDASNVVRITGSVTVEGGGGDIELSSVTYTIGETTTLQSLIYRVPN